MPDSKPEDSPKEPKQDSVDLSALQSFSFGTQWSAANKSDSLNPRFNKSGPRGGDRPDRRQGGSGAPRKDRRPARPGGGQVGEHATPEREGQGRPANRRDSRQGNFRPPVQPYQSPVFDICFYPEDNCFSAIIKAMRGNHLTYELFQVAKLFMEKPDRFVVSVTRKPAEGEKPEKVAICVLDNMPFLSEEEALAHAMAHHSEEVFTIEEVEVEPPSGNFPFVNRCPFTKELLGPPNYHKYEAALLNHHKTRLPNMPFEKLKSSIETVRDEEVVAAWLESQKKATRYTSKTAVEGEEAKVFDSQEDAMAYLRSELKDKLVNWVSYARVAGNVLGKHPDSEAFKAMNGERERQQRFPLDTANAIRGRMRREKFSIYKKGAKGVTYVCATKRNFRSPGQVMSPDLDRIIRFLEVNQRIKSRELPVRFEAWLKAESVETPFDEKKLLRDLHWLIADGYVSHFEDDSLFAQPVLESGAKEQGGPAKKKSVDKTSVKVEASAESPVGKPAALSESVLEEKESGLSVAESTVPPGPADPADAPLADPIADVAEVSVSAAESPVEDPPAGEPSAEAPLEDKKSGLPVAESPAPPEPADPADAPLADPTADLAEVSDPAVESPVEEPPAEEPSAEVPEGLDTSEKAKSEVSDASEARSPEDLDEPKKA